MPQINNMDVDILTLICNSDEGLTSSDLVKEIYPEISSRTDKRQFQNKDSFIRNKLNKWKKLGVLEKIEKWYKPLDSVRYEDDWLTALNEITQRKNENWAYFISNGGGLFIRLD